MLSILFAILVCNIISDNIIYGIIDTTDTAIISTIKPCKHGSFLINRYDTVISAHLELYGEWAESELELFLMIIKPGQVVLDIGANIGAFTVPLAKAVGASGKVFAFEPQRIINQILNTNIVLNNLENVYIYHAALGNMTGVIDMPDLDYHQKLNYGYFSLLNLDGYKSSGELETYSIPLLTLDSIFITNKHHNNQKNSHHKGGESYLLHKCPSFIKLDVEQMEVHVLQGGQQLLQYHCRPIIFSENNARTSSPALIQILYDLGYVPFWHFTSCYNADNYHQVSEDISHGWIDVNIVCIPLERLDNVSHPEAVFMDTSNQFTRIERDRPFVYQYFGDEVTNQYGIPYSHFQGP